MVAVGNGARGFNSYEKGNALKAGIKIRKMLREHEYQTILISDKCLSEDQIVLLHYQQLQSNYLHL